MGVERLMLLAIIWGTDFALFMIIFTVSRGLAESGADSLTLGLVGGGFSFAIGLSCLIGGRISDRVGQKRVILCGLTGILLGTWGCLALGSENRFYIPIYFLIAAATGLIFPSIITLLSRGRDAVTDRKGWTRMIMVYCITWNAGLISGQLTGGWFYHHDPVRPIQLALLLALINPLLLWVAARSHTSPPANSDQNTTAHLEHQAASATFARLAWIANLGGTFAMSMVFHLFPLLMIELHIPAREHGGLLALNRVIVVITYLVMYRVPFWHHRFSTAALSQITAAMSLLVLAAAHSRLGLIVGLVGLAQLLGYNYFASLYYSTTGVTEERRGTASGIHEFTLAMGFAAGAIGGGLLGQYAGTRAPYQLAAAFILLLLIVQLISLAAFRRKQSLVKT
jgi:MFS family permease